LLAGLKRRYDRGMVEIPMREYRYRVDREGRIFHDGSEIVDPAVLRFFLRAMRRTPAGAWLVVCQGEHNWFDVDDTPFVVQRVHLEIRAGALQAVSLELAGGLREPLDPTTLEAESDRLGCRIRNGSLPARFGRVALQQVAPFLDDDGASPALTVSGIRHPVRRAPDGRGTPILGASPAVASPGPRR
jgi:Protein of unknown function (DUF1285)